MSIDATDKPTPLGLPSSFHLTIIYVNLVFLTRRGLDLVGSYQLLEEVYKVDTTTSFFPFGSPSTPEELILKMGMPLGSLLCQSDQQIPFFTFGGTFTPLLMTLL